MRHLFNLFLLVAMLPFATQAQMIHSCGTTPYSEGFELQKDRLRNNLRLAAQGTYSARDISYVPIKFHVGARNDGSGRISHQKVLDQLCELNEDFAPLDIQFFLADGTVNYINNTTFYENHNATQNSVMAAQRDTRAMNVYVVESANIDGGSGGGVTLAYYSPPRDWIVITRTYIDEDDATLSHEIGHFFSLLHTFNGWECGGYNEEGTPAPTTSSCGGIGGNIPTERANGTNCENSGDYICDTPADYNNGIGWSGCNFTLQVQDPLGEIIDPDERNYMSYFLNCPDEEYFFSDQQIEAIQLDLNSSSRNFLRIDPVPEYVAIEGTATLIYPLADDVTDAYNYVNFQWEAVEGATQYLLEIDRVTSFSLFPIRIITSGTSAVVEELNADTRYYYRVRPYNAHYTCADNSATTSFRTGTEVVSTTSPEFVEAFTVAPNPVRAQNELQVYLNTDQAFSGQLELLDINGRATAIREQHQFALGENRISLELSDLPNGIYLLRMHSAEGILTQKIVLAR